MGRELLAKLRDLALVELGPHPELHTVGLGARHAFSRAFLDQLALEFPDGGQHVEHQAPGWRRCVDLLVEDDEIDSLLFKLADEFCQVGDRTSKPVKARHQELITFAHEVERSM